MVNKAKSLSNNSRKGIMLIILGIVLLFWLEYNSRLIDPEKIVWNIDKYLIEKLVNTALSIFSVLLIYIGIRMIMKTSDSIKKLDSNIEVKRYISSKIDSNDITPNKNIYLNEDLKHFGVGWITNDMGRISAIKNEDLELLGHGILKNDMGRISAIKNENLRLLGHGILKNDMGRISAIKNENLRLLGHGILKNDMGRISAIKDENLRLLGRGILKKDTNIIFAISRDK